MEWAAEAMEGMLSRVNAPPDPYAGPTVEVTLEVVAAYPHGWRVRHPGAEGRGVWVSCDQAFRLSPANVSPGRFRLPRWQYAKLAELL